ncbi:MAG: hypothetical protein AAFO84_12330, partial [Cyanobacteria bacterium J06598_1]
MDSHELLGISSIASYFGSYGWYGTRRSVSCDGFTDGFGRPDVDALRIVSTAELGLTRSDGSATEA